jgi:hypothetical protein
LTTVGKIVTFVRGADVYQEHAPSEVELQFTARPGGDDTQVVRGYVRSSSVICGDHAPSEPAAFGHRVEINMVRGVTSTSGSAAARSSSSCARGRGPHPSRLGRLDAGDRVLNDEALLRRHAQLLGPVRKISGCGFPCAKSRPDISASKTPGG